MIARQRGQTTGMSKDHEYTDWPAVETFVDEYLAPAGMVGSAKAG